MARLTKTSSNEEILAVLNETAEAVAVVLRANKDWSLSGLRDTQYSVDLRADSAALEVLHGAGVAVLSEESEITGTFGDDDLCVVMDPLDGSTNASRGVQWFATALCAIDKNGMRAGLVVNQANGIDRYWATTGGGAFHNGVAMRPSACVDLSEAVVGVSGIPKQRPKWGQFRALGAAALDICLVADGVIDAWIDFNTHGVWDYLASALICQEAGARIAEHQDRDLVVHQHGQRRTPIVAATPELLLSVRQVRAQQ
ncbi:MAG: inositol monophosphatase [Ilumatobacteraceae bacterium]|nr:inositol monophosphatase [Ilumatobacteraceae bacterium]